VSPRRATARSWVLAPPLDPAGCIRGNVSAHHHVTLLGDRARRRDDHSVHGIERRVTEPFAQAATASRSRARASNCGERRAKGPAGPRGEARCAKLVVRACDAADAVASVASAIGATVQASLPVSRERTTTWSRLRAWDAADAEARIGLGARLHGRGARTSPRSCRVHSRERLRASPRHVAGRPCSAASHRLRAWHRASRDRAIRPSCDGLTITACVAHTSRACVGASVARRAGRTEGRGAMREAGGSRMRRGRRRGECRVCHRRDGAGAAARVA
jgi:hypothetical protein